MDFDVSRRVRHHGGHIEKIYDSVNVGRGCGEPQSNRGAGDGWRSRDAMKKKVGGGVSRPQRIFLNMG